MDPTQRKREKIKQEAGNIYDLFKSNTNLTSEYKNDPNTIHDQVPGIFYQEMLRSINIEPTIEDIYLKKSIDRQTFIDKAVNHVAGEWKTEAADELIANFKMFDQDEKGYLSISDIRHILTQYGNKIDNEHVNVLAEAMRKYGNVTGSDYCMDVEDLANLIMKNPQYDEA